MMKSLEVTPACGAYIKSVLANGRQLSDKLEEKLDVFKGLVTICPNVKYHELSEKTFSCGSGVSISQCRNSLHERIADFLRLPNRFAIFEHWCAEATDPGIQRREGIYAFIGSSVYCPLPPFSTKEKVEKAIRSTIVASGFFGALGVLTPPMETPVPGSVITANELDQIVAGTQAVVMQAFDGEGWIWWESQIPNLTRQL